MLSSSGISYLNFEDISLSGIIYSSIFLFNILLISTLSLRFVFPIISLEGMTFWKIRTSPIKNLEMNNAKLLPLLALLLIVSILLSYFSHVKLAPHLTYYSIITMVCITYSIVMLNYAMGIIFVKYKEKNAIRIASSKGASLTFLFSVIYMLIIMIILFPAIQEHFYIALTSYYYSYKYIRIAYYLISVISIFTGTVFYIIAVKSLKTDY